MKTLYFICFFFQSFMQLVDAGALSASAEIVGINGGLLNGALIANAANPGIVNGALLGGQPQIAQVIPGVSPIVVLQPGIGLAQAGLPIIPDLALQQGLLLPLQQQQPGIPQGQLLQLPNGGAPLLAVLQQANVVAGLQVPAPNQLQLIKILPVAGANGNLQLPALQAAGVQAAGNGAQRVKHSAPANPNPAVPGSEAASLSSARPAMSLAEALKLPSFQSKLNPSK
ncbi:uncharacterized protein [Lepisosteus oculatus]|uniref:uncharacterized protein n=1 Tax=Lepisosteus oculatus TaxID=7918 RepID=UPI0035F52A4C